MINSRLVSTVVQSNDDVSELPDDCTRRHKKHEKFEISHQNIHSPPGRGFTHYLGGSLINILHTSVRMNSAGMTGELNEPH